MCTKPVVTKGLAKMSLNAMQLWGNSVSRLRMVSSSVFKWIVFDLPFATFKLFRCFCHTVLVSAFTRSSSAVSSERHHTHETKYVNSN
jgi:hypothetical protein